MTVSLLASVVRFSEDGEWKIMLETEEGKASFSDQSFATREEARAALEAWCKECGHTVRMIQ